MNYKHSIIWILLNGLLISPFHISAVPEAAELKSNFRSFRGLVDTFNKYTRISKRSLTDKEWQRFKATTERIGAVVGLLVVALAGVRGYRYFVPRKKSNRESIAGTELQEIKSSSHQLKTAFKEGNVPKIKELLELKVQLKTDELGLNDKNMLHTAINMHPKDAQPVVVETVLNVMKDEFDINQRNKEGAPPLFMVIHNIQQAEKIPQDLAEQYLAKMETVIDLLIENGANVYLAGPVTSKATSSSNVVLNGTLFDAADKIENKNIRDRVKTHLKNKNVRENPLL